MRNVKIDIEERVLHFKQPAGTSRGVYTERRIWLVTATDGQRQGMGECAPLPDLSCDAGPHYAEVLRQFCNDVERTGEIPYEAMRNFPSMLFGLETALTALHGCQLPSQKGKEPRVGASTILFDTAFSRGEVGIPINGLVWMGSYDEMLVRLEQKLEQGFRCVKLKIGAIDFDLELDLVRRIRRRFSRSEVEIRLDANGGFNYEEDVLYKLELLSQFAQSIEQPIKAGQWAYMAALCRDSPLPIALDEELIGVNDPEMKSHLLSVIKPAFIVLKPSLHGGMAGCHEWIAVAREHDVRTWITSALESNVGLNAIAQFCSAVYGDDITWPQGLGTGQLFTDNIPMPLEIRGDQLWRCASEE